MLLDNRCQCFGVQTRCLDPPPQSSLGSRDGSDGHRRRWHSERLKLPAQFLPAPTDHQQIHIPFHEEVVLARPPEHLHGDRTQWGPWTGAVSPFPFLSCPVLSWALLSQTGSARAPPCSTSPEDLAEPVVLIHPCQQPRGPCQGTAATTNAPSHTQLPSGARACGCLLILPAQSWAATARPCGGNPVTPSWAGPLI